MKLPTDLDAGKIHLSTLVKGVLLPSRVRTGWSIRGFNLPPPGTQAEWEQVGRVVVDIPSSWKGDLAGWCHRLREMTEAEQQQLIDDCFLLDPIADCSRNGSRLARCSTIRRLSWSGWMRRTAHGPSLWRKVMWRECLRKVETLIQNWGWELTWNKHLGYISTCPSNLRTGLQAGVHLEQQRQPLPRDPGELKIPKLWYWRCGRLP